MNLKDIVNLMNVKGTAAMNINIIIKVDSLNKILYDGKVKDFDINKIEGGNWSVLSINPDYSVRRLKDYDGIPDYNLPYIIVVY